ncbi:MAG: ABC transporter ATP-binding protein [Myxococcota bacterium]
MQAVASMDPEKLVLLRNRSAFAREHGIESPQVLHEGTAPLAQLLRVIRQGTAVMVEQDDPVIIRKVRGPFAKVETLGGNPHWRTLASVRRELGDRPLAYVALRDEVRALSLRAAPGEPRPTPIQRTVRLLRLEREDVAVVLVYGIALGLLSLAVPIAVQSLVNTVAFGTLLQPLFVLALLLAVALLGGAYLRALQFRVVEMLQRRLFVRVVSELSELLPRVRSDAFRKSNGPELLNRFFDVFTTQKSVSSLLLGGLDALLITLVGMTVLAFYHPVLLAFDVVLVFAALLVFGVLGRRGIDSSVKESKAKYAVADWLEEMARHPLSFKMRGGAAFGRSQAERLATRYLEHRNSHFRVVFRQLVGALGMQVIASVSLLAIGGFLVIERQLSIGQLVAAELIVTAVVAAIAKLGEKVEVYYDLLTAVDKLGDILDLPTEDSHADPVPPVGIGGDELVVSGLKVTSGDEEFAGEDPGLELSFSVKPGEAVLLAGYPERSRRQITNALYALRTPKAHAITVGTLDQRDVSLDYWRSKVALVREESLLPCAIRTNVQGDSPATLEIWAALDAVGLREDIRALPDGLDTILGDGGAPLSGSRARRLTIARAIAARPSILILDGILDQIDPDQRAVTIESLRAVEDLSLIILSNHASLASSVDRVVSSSDLR